jgi:S-methylmethionine-dependent homocysteine/selenocysteine methylase
MSLESKQQLLQRVLAGQGGTGLVVVDGGMGTELKAQGVFKDLREYTTLWSAASLLHEEGRQAVKAAHRAYIDAGARVIITNSYACTTEILTKGGICHRQEELIEIACKIAHEAVMESGKVVLVAGSMPPLSVSYRPDLVLDPEVLKTGYEKIASTLSKSKVDLFMCETMACITEAKAAATAAANFGKPIFVAVTLDKPVKERKRKRASSLSSVLRSGESLMEMTKQLDSAVDGFLINCCSPEAATLGLKQLVSITQKPCGVYANHFEPIPRDWKLEQADESAGLLKIRSDLDPVAYAKYAQLWATMGATMIGGCCGISPEHIQVLSDTLVGADKHACKDKLDLPSSAPSATLTGKVQELVEER